MSRISAIVSGATLKSLKRAAKRATRRMRTGSSRKASVTWRSTLALQVALAAVGVDQAIS
jgi:hypothetical protein